MRPAPGGSLWLGLAKATVGRKTAPRRSPSGRRRVELLLASTIATETARRALIGKWLSEMQHSARREEQAGTTGAFAA